MDGLPASPLVWLHINSDLMGLCLVISWTASGIAIFLKNARGSSIAVALLSSFLFVGVIIPYIAVHYHWYWTDLAIVSALIGFASLTIAWSAMRIATALQNKAEGAAIDMASRWISDKSGNPPSPKPPTAEPETPR